MAGQYTFADLYEEAWENDVFETRKDAIKSGKKQFPNGFVLGRLEKKNDSNYTVVEIDRFYY